MNQCCRTALWLCLAFMLFFPLSSSLADQDSFQDPSVYAPEDTLSNYGVSDSSFSGSPRVEGGNADRITLELKGVNVLDVLKILAKRSGLNIVAGRDVRGDVTLYMQDVEVRKALDTIVQTLGLAYEERDGIITVMSEKEFVSRYGKPFKDERVTETFRLKYANPQTMNQLVQQMKSPSGKIAVDEKTATIIATDLKEVVDDIGKAVEEFDQPLATQTFFLKYGIAADVGEELKDYLTPSVGILKMDKRANQITVTDRAAIVEQIAGVVESFDTRPLQVLIEAKVVEVQLYDAFRFGIDWNYVDLKAGQIRNISLTPAQTVSAPGASLGSGSLSAFTIGTSAGNDTLQTVVNILSNIGKTNVLSSPRLLCLNNEEAKLSVATRQPYVTQTVNVTSSTSNTADDVKFIDVGVTLSIVPTISADGNVVLKVRPEVSSQSGTFTIEGVAQASNTLFDRTKVPIVTSQSLETTVVAKDGVTVVVGGLIQDRQAKIRKKIPVLADIPFLGAAFRTESNDFNKTELVIFLTPHIVTGKGNSLEAGKYVDASSDFIPFDKVAGYDFTKAEGTTSQGPFRMDDKPYYDSPVKERPVYFPPASGGVESARLRGYVNQHEAEQASSALEVKTVKFSKKKTVQQVAEKMEEAVPEQPVFSSSHQARRAYREKIASAIQEALSLRRNLGKYPLEIGLFLIIEKTGRVTLKRLVKDDGLSASGRAVVLETVDKLSPFPPFPADMKSDQELLDLKIQLS